MQLGRKFIGLPIFDERSNTSIGIISDLVFDATGRLTAISIAPLRGVFRTEKTVSIQSFTRLTSEGAYVDGIQRLEPVDIPPTGSFLSAKNKGLCGRDIVGADGHVVGLVGDVVVGAPHFDVKGFEVSDGVIMDFLDGRQVISSEGASIRDGEIVLPPQHDTDYMNGRDEGHPTDVGNNDRDRRRR